MPLYICNYCDYNSKNKHNYYRHLHTHLTFEHIIKFDPNEMELCMFYYNKHINQITKYHQNNKDKIKEKDTKYYQNNKDKIKERKLEYRQNNKDKIKERNEKYYQNNKDKVKELHAQYRLKKKLEETELTIIDVSDEE